MGRRGQETHGLVMANALNKEDAELWFPFSNLLHEKVSPVDRAVGGVQDADSAIAVDEVVQEFLQGVHGHFLTDRSRGSILGIEKLGRLVIVVNVLAPIAVCRFWVVARVQYRFLGDRAVVQVQFRGLIGVRGGDTIQEDGSSLEPSIHARCILGGRGRVRRLATGRDSSPVADIEDPCVVLLPRQVARNLLCDVTLAARREPDHDDDQFGGNIAFRNLAVRRYPRPCHAGDAESRGMRTYAWGVASGVLAERRTATEISHLGRKLDTRSVERGAGAKTHLRCDEKPKSKGMATYIRGDPGAVEFALRA